ncbi:hypothetical protein, partial [Endothiovibrio diazotrophicus]
EAPELPPLPEVEDRAAMERWGRLVAAEQRETGVSEGLERGLAEGLKRETARARKIAGTLLAKGMAAEEVRRSPGSPSTRSRGWGPVFAMVGSGGGGGGGRF